MFENTRRIVGAEMQNIVYGQYLTAVPRQRNHGNNASFLLAIEMSMTQAWIPPSEMRSPQLPSGLVTL